MTDPRDPNQQNPLRMRVSAPWPFPTLGQMDYGEHEKNWLALMRDGGAWTDRFYSKNETVYSEGIRFLAEEDIPAGTAPEPIEPNASDWVPISGINGRGTMELATPIGVPGSIPTGDNWVTLPFDTVSFTPVGIEFVPVSGLVDLDYRGLWDFSLLFSFSHDESNQGRDFKVRIFNVTAGTPAPGLQLFIGRNQPGTTLQANFDTLVTTGTVGDTFRFEVGDASQPISVVQWTTTLLMARQFGVLTVGPAQRDFLAPKVENLFVQKLQDEFNLVSWNAATGATNYVLERQIVGETDNWAVETITSDVTYNDLSQAPSTRYEYRVAGQNASGLGPWSDVAQEPV